MKKTKGLFWITLILVVAASVLILYPTLLNLEGMKRAKSTKTDKGGLDMVEHNYGREIDSCAKIFGLSSAYLKSLTMLECSGKGIITPRFEPHVYNKLKKVRDGKLNKYENVTKAIIGDASDDALKNLASSWGPFQLMGYKCILLGINIKDIRGDNSVYWGVKWIDLTYGKKLKNGKFKDAFHIHNTGRPFPIIGKPFTHDPDYVYNGLKYMEFFKK